VPGNLIDQPSRPNAWTLFQLECLGHRGEVGESPFALQSQPEGSDVLRIAVRQVGERAIFDLAVFPIGLAQKDTAV